MAIQKQTITYEILFRLDNSGLVQGAHRKDIRLLVDDQNNEVLSRVVLPAAPIAGTDMDSVLGELNTSLSSSVSALQNDIAIKDQQIEDLTNRVSQLETQLSNV